MPEPTSPGPRPLPVSPTHQVLQAPECWADSVCASVCLCASLCQLWIAPSLPSGAPHQTRVFITKPGILCPLTLTGPGSGPSGRSVLRSARSVWVLGPRPGRPGPPSPHSLDLRGTGHSSYQARPPGIVKIQVVPLLSPGAALSVSRRTGATQGGVRSHPGAPWATGPGGDPGRATIQDQLPGVHLSTSGAQAWRRWQA